MSSFTLKDHNIPVTLPEGLTEEKLLSFHPFKTWLKTLTTSLARQSTPTHSFHSAPYALRSITVQAFDLFGRPPNQHLGFVKLKSTVSNSQGESLPGSIFLRGPSVAMLVILVPDDVDAAAADAERHVLLTVQPRVAAGSLAFVELPAGMVDEEGAFVGTAAAEIREELGLEIAKDELLCLSDLAGEAAPPPTGKGGSGGDGRGEDEGEGEGEGENLPHAMYPSAGGCDEFIRIYLHERRVPRAQLGEWTGRLTGLREEGEKITLKLVPMRDLWREGARDAKSLAALALYEGLKKEGRI